MTPFLNLVLGCILCLKLKCTNVALFKNSHLLEDIFELLFELFLNKYLDDKTFKWTQFLSCLTAEGTPCLFP